MKPLTRVLAAVCAATLTVPVWTTSASAQTQTGSETGTSYAYFTATATPKPNAAPGAPPNLIADSDVDGVAKGNLGVAAQASRESKVSFVYFSLSSIPFGSKITRAVMTIPLAPNGEGNRLENAKPTNVRACAPDDSGFGGQDGAPLHGVDAPEGAPQQTEGAEYQGAPERKCDLFQAPATASADGKSYRFDLSGLAATWDVANDGVALTRTETSDANFQIVFTPEATLDFDYVPPVEEDFGTGTDIGTGTDTGSDFGTGDTSVGGFDDGGFATDTGGDFSADAGPLTGAELPALETPQAADEPAVAARTQASGGPIEMLSLTPSFWLAALLLAGVLAFLGLILGDRRSPALAVATSRQSRLTRALSAPPERRPSLLG